MPPSKLDRILSAESALQPLLARSRELRELARSLRGFVPAELADQIRAANLREGKLVLVAANAAAAARLRLLVPSLIRFLSGRRGQVNGVSIRVQPSPSRKSNVASHHHARLTPRTIADLRSLFARLSDSPARTALGRLLAHHAEGEDEEKA